MSKLTHKQLETFVTETLSKREPCPAMVLAWGWMLKQGEGGFFHGDSFKQRFFVLARVPHSTVLIYYGERTMDEENILGFIDLRRVTSVKESSKAISIDGAGKATGASGGGFLAKLGGLFGGGGASAPAPAAGGSSAAGGSGASAAAGTRAVIELVTPGRTYVLVPATIAMPPPMTTSAALTACSSSRPLYLFGWPFPVPAIDPATGEEAEVASMIGENKVPVESYAQWRDVLTTAVTAEKATRQFPVVTLVDSTGQLPQRVIVRTTPCELAIVSVDDKDLCFGSIPYNDLLKWDVPDDRKVDQEIHITARTRARLTAKPDRTGFASQRPTRPTCFYVFKAAQAKMIAQVIDNHLRALAKQLAGLGDGADEGEVAASASASAAAGGAGEGAEGGSGAEPEDSDAKGKLTGKKPAASTRKVGTGSDDEDGSGAKKAAAADSDDDSDGDARPSKASPRKSASKGGKKPAAADSDDDSDDAPAPKASPKGGKGSKGGKKAAADSDDEDSDDEDPAPKGKKPAASKGKKAAAASDDDDDDEDAKPAKKPAAKAGKKAAAKDSDDEDD